MVKVQANSQDKIYVTSNGKALTAKNFGTKSITENGIYTANSDSLDGYSSVTVEVNSGTSPIISSLSITPSTSSQTITAPSGTDGYNPISIAAVDASVDSNITAENIKKDVTILNVTGTYEGSGGGGKYKLLDRVKDDSNNEIGTVSGFFTDANNVEYAVVCLDAQYRSLYGVYCSSTSEDITNLPIYEYQDLWSSRETATFNTQKILDFCTSNNYTSSACTHCRSKSFTIDNITYYGQLPNIVEIIDIFKNRIFINALDPYTNITGWTNYKIPNGRDTWSSNQRGATWGWCCQSNGCINYWNRTMSYFTIPVLEIPNS